MKCGKVEEKVEYLQFIKRDRKRNCIAIAHLDSILKVHVFNLIDFYHNLKNRISYCIC